MQRTLITVGLILSFLGNSALAEEFVLPNSFAIEKYNLPKVEEVKEVTIATAITERPVVSKPTNISLINLIRNYEFDYINTLNSTLIALSEAGIEPVGYDSSLGQIKARLDCGKELFILLLPSRKNLTHVRITPADGRYDISLKLIKEIFEAINNNLNKV